MKNFTVIVTGLKEARKIVGYKAYIPEFKATIFGDTVSEVFKVMPETVEVARKNISHKKPPNRKNR